MNIVMGICKSDISCVLNSQDICLQYYVTLHLDFVCENSGMFDDVLTFLNRLSS